MKFNLTDNLTFKIISLVMGLVLYLFVMQERADERVIRYSVELEEPEGYMLLSDVPDLRVVVTGRNRHLSRVDERQSVTIALRGPQTHRRFIESDFSLPAGLEIKSIDPPSVTLNFARLVAREVPILVNPTGSPELGYSVTGQSVTPSTIRVEGPEEAMDRLTGIFTQPIDISGWTETQRRRVNLIAPGEYISYDTGTAVWVTIEIEQDEATRPISDIPVTLSGPTDRFAVDHQTVTAVLHGPRAALESLDPTNLRASIDVVPFLEFPAGTYDAQPHLINLPANIHVEDLTPNTLRLTMEAQPTFNFAPILLFNLLPFPLPTQLGVLPAVLQEEIPEPTEEP